MAPESQILHDVTLTSDFAKKLLLSSDVRKHIKLSFKHKDAYTTWVLTNLEGFGQF